VDSDGKITEINTSEPSGGYIDIKEIVIVGYHGLPEDEPVESPDHEILISEGKRVINSFPVINIPELKGKPQNLTSGLCCSPIPGAGRHSRKTPAEQARCHPGSISSTCEKA
jgi:hypothetical protein